MIKRYIIKKLKEWLGWYQIRQDIYRLGERTAVIKDDVCDVTERVDSIDAILGDYKEELDSDVVVEVTVKEYQVHKLNEFLKELEGGN